MFTLKVHCWRSEMRALDTAPPVESATVESITEQADHFILAEQVSAWGYVTEGDMSAWEPGSYVDFRAVHTEDGITRPIEPARLIETRNAQGESRWYLVSKAWLLGPTGDTIERLAP